MPANVGPFLAVVVALFVVAHIAVRRLAPFGVRLLCHTRTPDPAFGAQFGMDYTDLDALLREAFDAARRLRAERREALGLVPGETARGLGKLLVVAPDQEQARRYLDLLQGWVPRGQQDSVRLATSEAAM